MNHRRFGKCFAALVFVAGLGWGAALRGAETAPALHVRGDVLAAFSVKDIRPFIPALTELLQAMGEVPEVVNTFLQGAGQVIAGRMSLVMTPAANRPGSLDGLIVVSVDESRQKVDDLLVKTFKGLADKDTVTFSTVGGIRQLQVKNSPIALYWTVRGGQLFLGSHRRTVLETLAPQGARPKSFAACKALGKYINWSGDVTGFVNLHEVFWKQMDKRFQQDGEPDWPLSSTAWLYKWLAPNQLSAVGFSWTGDGQGGSGRVAVLAPSPRTGLLTMFDLPNRPPANLDQIPEQVQVFSAMMPDTARLAERWAALMKALDPDVAEEFRSELSAFNKELGVNLEKDLLGNFGAFTAAARLPGGGMLGTYSVVELRDPAAFQKSVEALARYNETPLRTATRNGRTFHLFPTRPSTGYTVVGNRLYYSDSFEAIEEMLALGQGGKTLAASEPFRKLRARLPRESLMLMAVDAQWAANFVQTALAWLPPLRQSVNLKALDEVLEPLREAGPGLSVGAALRNEPDAFVLHLESRAGDVWKLLPELLPALGRSYFKVIKK
jgi:hypothetical protein